MTIRAHFPAHQGRLALPGSVASEQLERDARYIDLGKLRAAEQLMAAQYGAKHSFFLSNGASQGLRIAMLCAARVGARVAVPLNAHIATLHGIILSGLEPVFIPSLGPSPTVDELLAFLSDPPTVSSLLVTNPCYDGSAIDLRPVLNRCRALQMFVIVDEVHGTHLHWLDRGTPSALSVGADLVVHSTHKYAGALTQSALLHVGEASPMTVDEVASNTLLFGTTSRSNLINLSTERAADFLASESYRRQAEASATRMDAIHADIDNRDSGGLRRLSSCVDPWKLPLCSDSASGFEIADLLAEGGIDHEYVSWSSALFVCSLANTADDQAFLARALRALHERLCERDPLKRLDRLPQRTPRIRVLPRTAFLNPATELIPLSAAEGRISAMTLRSDDAATGALFQEIMSGDRQRTSLYDGLPPGTPILIPGEIITAWHSIAIHPDIVVRVLT